jgi:ABC-2 type transport system ATP-binding protein
MSAERAGSNERSGVEVKSLAQGYRSHLVIKDLDFAAVPGVVWLLGPNGAGKTTLLRTLATVSPPRGGTLKVLGEVVSDERSARRARSGIGYLPQQFGFYPSFSVYDFVRYCGWLRGVAERNAHEAALKAIGAVGLERQAGTPMKRLSGGMAQRAGIASAIVGRPPLLLLDEPTVGLDPAQRMDFRNLIRSLDRTTVVLSTHLVEDVRAVGGGVVVMNEGRAVFRGTAEELEAAAQPDYAGDSALERGYMSILGTGQVTR